MAWLVMIKDTEQNGGWEFRFSIKKKKKDVLHYFESV